MIPPRPHRSTRGNLPNSGRYGRPLLFNLRALRAQFTLIVVVTKFLLLPGLLALWHRRSLRHCAGPAGPAAANGVVVVAPFYGNEPMLAAFLAHHRGIGVREFVFLDLSASGGLAQLLADQGTCAVWRPHTPPPAGAFAGPAIYWLNFLRRRYGNRRWVLSLEPWDLLVFHRSETRQINDLVDFLISEQRDHAFALVIEMYGDNSAAAMTLKPGDDPLGKLAYFDPLGYTTTDPGPHRNVIVRGGVQRRTVWAEAPRNSPALNRIPLVKWRWYYAYVAGTRLVMPRRLNTPHSPWHSSPTLCLLRFALLDEPSALAIAAPVEGQEIVADGGGQSLSGVGELRSERLKISCSMRYRTSEDLVACGLLNPGQWF